MDDVDVVNSEWVKFSQLKLLMPWCLNQAYDEEGPVGLGEISVTAGNLSNFFLRVLFTIFLSFLCKTLQPACSYYLESPVIYSSCDRDRNTSLRSL